ncbi:unnamed protein product [Rotaria magnacalcarata]|uniref:Major facilitator superfamily (MFS) profile domain-containing protein n=1 Tax=Rotaria magnacalcarata TaxID=392030 RepID=A0A816L2K8_9BILA|nr:unnamed protein product [Rotaria magnacalcarata]
MSWIGLFSLAGCVLIWTLPESPRWLVQDHQKDEAARSLRMLRQNNLIEAELDEIERQEATAIMQDKSLCSMCFSPRFRWPLLTSVALNSVQQFSGINSVFFYSSTTFSEIGFVEDKVYWGILSTGIINLIATIGALKLVELFGRRSLILYPLVMIIFVMILLCVFIEMHKPIVVLSLTLVFIVLFAIGLGPIPYIYPNEVFTIDMRPAALSISMFASWLCNTYHTELLKSVQEKIQFIEKQIFIYSLFAEKEKTTLFLWHIMLINILKQLPQNECSHDELLDQIELFRRNSTSEQVVERYLNECFLKKLLNRVIYTADFDVLYATRFFLLDSCCQIEQEHENIKNETYLIVYRTQIMSMEEIEKLKKSIENDENTPRIYLELGQLINEIKQYHLALQNYQSALDIYQKQLSKDNIRIVSVLNYIELVCKHMGNLDRAMDYYRQSLNIYKSTRSKDEDHLHRIHTMMNLALAYRDKKKELDIALNYLTKVYDIRRNILSNDHSLLVNILIHIANIYYDNDFNQALEYYQQILSIEEITHPNDRLNKATTLRQIGLLYWNKHDWHNALNYLNHTLKIMVILSFYDDKFYWKCRMFDRALLCQMKLLDLQRSKSTSNNQDIDYWLRDLARFYRAMNKSNEALKYFDQSLSILKTKYGSEHGDVKNIQKEILDLKEILTSLSADADENYNYRRCSNAHKQLFIIPYEDPISRSSTLSCDRRKKSSVTDLASAVCVIL